MPGAIPIPSGATADVDPAVLASLAPPPAPEMPGGDLTAEQLAAAATVPRPAFPDNPIDAVLSAAPVTSLAPPSPVVPGAPPPAPATPTDEAARNLAERRAVGEESVANATEKAALEKEKADKAEAFKAESAARLAKLQAEQELHRQAAAAHVADLRGQAESEPYHKFWETRSTGQEILTAIGLILGGVSWNANHVNRGVEMLNNAMNRDLQLQKDKHADLWHRVDEAQQGVRDMDAADLHELAAFQAAEGAKWDAVSGRLNAMIAANKGKGDITTAKSAAVDANEKATLAWQNAEHATALANHYKAQEAAEKERADAAMFKAQHPKGRGLGGGGGGGTRLADALVKFNEAAAALKPGEPASADVIRLGVLAGFKRDKIQDQIKKARDAAAESQGAAAKGENANLTITNKLEDKAVRDPSTKKVIGLATTAKDAAKLRGDLINLREAAHRMDRLAEEVEKNGTRIDPTDFNAVQRRITAFKNAIIAIGVVSPLGKTNETLHLETSVLGPSGTVNEDGLKKYILSSGAYLPGIKEKAKEMHDKINNTINSLTPLSPEQEKALNGAQVGGGGGKQIPIGATSTSGGKPIRWSGIKWEEVK